MADLNHINNYIQHKWAKYTNKKTEVGRVNFF